MNAADAIYVGFADHFLPLEDWPALIADLEEHGDSDAVAAAARPAPDGKLETLLPEIDTHFSGEALGDILNSLRAVETDFAAATLKQMMRNSPLAMACAVEMTHRLRGADDIRTALGLEYRYTARAMEHGDFLEGIRAAIIDKDRSPKWKHDGIPPLADVGRMLQPLGANKLTFKEGS